MSFEVLVDELRSAANAYDGVAGSLGGSPVTVTGADPDTMGHVELAAWLVAVSEQCTNAHEALSSGATGLASSLRTAASEYEVADGTAADRFGLPYLRDSTPTNPFPYPFEPLRSTPGPVSPFAERPVLGPPVPGSEG